MGRPSETAGVVHTPTHVSATQRGRPARTTPSRLPNCPTRPLLMYTPTGHRQGQSRQALLKLPLPLGDSARVSPLPLALQKGTPGCTHARPPLPPGSSWQALGPLRVAAAQAAPPATPAPTSTNRRIRNRRSGRRMQQKLPQQRAIDSYHHLSPWQAVGEGDSRGGVSAGTTRSGRVGRPRTLAGASAPTRAAAGMRGLALHTGPANARAGWTGSASPIQKRINDVRSMCSCHSDPSRISRAIADFPILADSVDAKNGDQVCETVFCPSFQPDKVD